MSVKDTAEARDLIIKNPALFTDFEITKGKMDDVFCPSRAKARRRRVMKTFLALTKRNIKVFLRTRECFHVAYHARDTSCLVRHVSGKSLQEHVCCGVAGRRFRPRKLISGMVAGELVSSLLAVCCVTVAFCSNTLMVNDRITGARKDLLVSPAKRSVIAASYFSGTFFTTLIVTYAATAAGLIYVAASGWYMSFSDVVLIIVDVFLLTAFGTALSSVVNALLRTQGQAAGIGTIVSAGYGFICGAYMPISSFGKGLQNFIMLLPGTYGTSLLRNHSLNGVYGEMAKQGFPKEVIDGVKDGVDCNLYFFGDKVSVGAMYGVLIGAVVVLSAVYVLICYIAGKNKNPFEKVKRKGLPKKENRY